MAHRARHEHDVAVTLPERLVGNANFATLGIAGLRPISLRRKMRCGTAVVETRILTKDPVVELAELGTWLDAELVGERGSQLAVRAQGVGLAAAPVQREDELVPEALA